MLGEEARVLLGFLPNSTPSSSQVKAAYKKKAWETHPDRFPVSQRSLAESNFKLISEAYTCLQSGVRREVSASGTYYYSRVVRTGVPRANGGSRNHALIGIPFLCIVLGTVALGGSSATSYPLAKRVGQPVVDSRTFVTRLGMTKAPLGPSDASYSIPT